MKLNARFDKKGVWVVTTIEIAHNHSTVIPQKYRCFRSHKCLDEYSKKMLNLKDRACIQMKKNFEALVDVGIGSRILNFKRMNVGILLTKPNT